MTGGIKRRFLWVLKNTLNRATLRAARVGRGPFSLVRHVGRKTGRVYETPLILARAQGGFVAELTYGPDVAWYRNIVAAGNCVIIFKGIEHHIDRIESCSPAEGLRAFRQPAASVLKLLRRHEFRFLRESASARPDTSREHPADQMARINTVTAKDASTSTTIMFWFTARLIGRLAGRRPEGMLVPLQLYAHLPRLLRAYGRLEQATSALHGVNDRHRALAELKAATVTNCEYCIDLGSQVARQWGLSDAELLAIPSYATSDLFTEVDKLVLDYAAGISSTPVDVDDELVTRLKDHFSDAELVELTHVIALENHRGRFNLALGVGSAGFSDGQACAVPESGYGQRYYRTTGARP